MPKKVRIYPLPYLGFDRKLFYDSLYSVVLQDGAIVSHADAYPQRRTLSALRRLSSFPLKIYDKESLLPSLDEPYFY